MNRPTSLLTLTRARSMLRPCALMLLALLLASAACAQERDIVTLPNDDGTQPINANSPDMPAMPDMPVVVVPPDMTPSPDLDPPDADPDAPRRVRAIAITSSGGGTLNTPAHRARLIVGAPAPAGELPATQPGQRAATLGAGATQHGQ